MSHLVATFGPWLLSVLGLLGLIWLRYKQPVTWLYFVGVKALWIVFALTTGQLGFIFAAVGYSGVFIHNYLGWRRDGPEVALAPLVEAGIISPEQARAARAFSRKAAPA